MVRDIAGNGEGTIGQRPASGFASAIRAFGALMVCIAGLIVFSSNALAQANIHNGGVPLNVDQNTSTTSSGTLEDRGSDSNAGTIPYNGAQFDFDYVLTGDGVFNDGVEYRVQSGTQIIYLQTRFVDVANNNFVTYTIDFDRDGVGRGVEGLTFRIGGLDNEDTNRIEFRYQGTLINVSTAYLSGVSVNDANQITAALLSPTLLEVASRNESGASGDLTLNFGEITVPPGVLVDEVRIVAGKNPGRPSSANNTISFFNFDWLPIPIDAVNDSADGVNGTDGQSNVLNVLTNDTLDDPNTPATDPATTTNVVITQDATSNAGVTLNEATGEISVAAGTPPSTYTVNYTICQDPGSTVPANCDSAVATITVTPRVDLSVTKSNGTDAVVSGSTATYSITVTNSGPDAAVGAVVSDTPGAGIICDAAAPVTITGDGVPAGTFTFADLSGAGITLGTLNNGESAILSYSCQVN